MYRRIFQYNHPTKLHYKTYYTSHIYNMLKLYCSLNNCCSYCNEYTIEDITIKFNNPNIINTNYYLTNTTSKLKVICSKCLAKHNKKAI